MKNQRSQRKILIGMGAIIVLTLSAVGFQKVILARGVTGQAVNEEMPTLTMGGGGQIFPRLAQLPH